MGVRGPIPGPGVDRRERKAGWTTLPNVPTSGVAPALVGDHTTRAVKQWERWWATPMASMWAPWDADALERLLDLYELHWLKEPTNLAEIRQLEDRYGLTPASRRRLMWQVEGVDSPSKEAKNLGHGDTPAPAARPRAGSAADPRLTVVKNTG